MTELRKRMIETLQLRGMSERTQQAYVRAVRQLVNSLAALHCTRLLGVFLTLLTSELEAVKALRRVVA